MKMTNEMKDEFIKMVHNAKEIADYTEILMGAKDDQVLRDKAINRIMDHYSRIKECTLEPK